MSERVQHQRELFQLSSLKAPPPPPRRISPDLPDARTELWHEGTKILMALTGKRQAPCRNLLGRLLKSARDDVPLVMKTLMDAVDMRPMLPVPWITAVINARCESWNISKSEMLRQDWGLGSVQDGC